MESIQQPQILNWLAKAAADFRIHSSYLNELDAVIGDADHGSNLDRGFTKVAAQLPTLKEATIGKIFKKAGAILMESVGGVSGVLYATFFLEASKVAANKMVVTLEDLFSIIEAGAKGIRSIGKAQPGDKTIVDTLSHATISLRLSIIEKDTLRETLLKMEDAAARGMSMTTNLIAKKGKASYLGTQSVGHQDPGATSIYILLACLCEVILQKEIEKEIPQNIHNIS